MALATGGGKGMSGHSNAWNSLTEEQKKTLEKEYQELQDWYKQEHERIEAEIKKEEARAGIISPGLDANQKRFGSLIQEHRKRFAELQKKYGFRTG